MLAIKYISDEKCNETQAPVGIITLFSNINRSVRIISKINFLAQNLLATLTLAALENVVLVHKP